MDENEYEKDRISPQKMVNDMPNMTNRASREMRQRKTHAIHQNLFIQKSWLLDSATIKEKGRTDETG